MGFFVIPPTAGLLRMTSRNMFSGWTLVNWKNHYLGEVDET